MALISLRQLLDHAAERGYGVPAYNVNNLEQMRAIMEAADETDSPVIVQASAGARKYARPQFLRYLMNAALEQYPDVPVCIHQDHGTSPDVCQRSIQMGFDPPENAEIRQHRISCCVVDVGGSGQREIGCRTQTDGARGEIEIPVASANEGLQGEIAARRIAGDDDVLRVHTGLQ